MNKYLIRYRIAEEDDDLSFPNNNINEVDDEMNYEEEGVEMEE